MPGAIGNVSAPTRSSDPSMDTSSASIGSASTGSSTLPAPASQSMSNQRSAALPGPSRSSAHQCGFSSGRSTDTWLAT